MVDSPDGQNREPKRSDFLYKYLVAPFISIQRGALFGDMGREVDELSEWLDEAWLSLADRKRNLAATPESQCSACDICVEVLEAIHFGNRVSASGGTDSIDHVIGQLRNARTADPRAPGIAYMLSCSYSDVQDKEAATFEAAAFRRLTDGRPSMAKVADALDLRVERLPIQPDLISHH